MKFLTSPALFTAILALATSHRVTAHGVVTEVRIIGDTSFTGPKPGFTGSNKSPIRAVTDQAPVKDLQSKDMICGWGATPGSVIASAKPGDSLVYTWGNAVAEDGNWIHNVGPMMTYMAQVPAGQTADTFDGVGAKWFKTDEAGKKGSQWVQASLMQGKTYTTQIPETLADGDYLVRHEIIALHNAANKGGAEFYPSCFQLRIKNSNAGNATVTASPTVSFPGAYSATDPGILVNVFDDNLKYKFPAGPIANVTAPGATGTSPNAAAEASTSSVVSETTTILATSAAVPTSAAVTSTTAVVTTASVTRSAIITSAASSTVSSSSVSVPVTTPSGLAAIRLANGRTAQELNLRFKTLSTTDNCQPRDPGCIDGQFAVCTSEGNWIKQGACFIGASCFAIPLKNINGTQVGCFPEAVVEQAMIDSGVGRTIATETASSSAPTSTALMSAIVSTTSATVSNPVASTTSASVSTRVASTAPSSPVASVITSISSTPATPSATPTPISNGRAPAVVIGIGSKPARRMLRWERRSSH